MSRVVNRAENWERAYEAFQQVNFAAWDFQTVKESLIDYLKLYYPEDFNDFIESSELIALLELFAYVSELAAYRLDMNAHENFISTAERKESILRLAKLLSYNSNRNIPSRGLVKIMTVSTSERVFDSNGNDLANTTIRWNDPDNSDWKEQFILVMNKVMDQQFGVVAPSDRVQVQDVLFERYKFINNPLVNNVLPYSITVSNETLPMELVSATLNEFGPLEARPEKDINLGVLFLNDGLGDSSENTGFFMFTKQGSIKRTQTTFDGITPNQTFDVELSDSNEIDIFLNNIDPDTGLILEDSDDLNAEIRLGEWIQVDTVGGQNIVFTTNTNRNRYEIETLDNDQFRIIFGDGNFANVPSGTFEIWSRQSANTDNPISTTSLQNVAHSFTYSDLDSKEQTCNFTVSLLTPIQNAAPSEDIEHIRKTAPSVYYTQDRMVNGRDYNEFLLQDNTILKLRAINRTFAGDSKYIPWHDASEHYDNVKIFGDDGVLYFNTRNGVEEICVAIQESELPAENSPLHADLIDALIDNHIEPLLSSGDFFTRFVVEEIPSASIRTEFTTAERVIIETAILPLITSGVPSIIYVKPDISAPTYSWVIGSSGDYWFTLSTVSGTNDYELCYESLRIVFHSDETRFWNVNDGTVITDDTLNGNLDTMVVLRPNVSAPAATPPTTLLTQDYNFDVPGQVLIDKGEDSGQRSIHDIYTIPEDANSDGFPDEPDLSWLFGAVDYVYFNRETINDTWVFQTVNQTLIDPAALELQDEIDHAADPENRLWKKESGIEGLNFAWFHRTPRYHLIDPSTTNIIDMYIITRGYAKNLRLWLNGQLPAAPTAPTPFQLRSDYQNLLESKMLSDTVILHPGSIKVLFGSKAHLSTQGTIKIIRSSDRSLSANQIKTSIVDVVNAFFDINLWEFGETFYFSELSASIHSKLPTAIDSVVLVPISATSEFGDLYQIRTREDEIVQVDFSVDQVEIVESLNSDTLSQ